MKKKYISITLKNDKVLAGVYFSQASIPFPLETDINKPQQFFFPFL